MSTRADLEKLTESVWLRLAARGAMVVTPLLFSALFAIAWAVGANWIAGINTSLRETMVETRALRNNLDTLATTVSIRVEQMRDDVDDITRRLDRLEDRINQSGGFAR